MRRQSVYCVAALVVAVLATFGRAIFTDQVFYERDILNYWCPHIEVFVRAVAEHALPLWNPYAGFGMPLLADPSLALAYPLTWLNLILRPAIYYELFVVSHCVWGGVGALLLARRRGLPAHASLVAALAFCLSGPFLSGASLFHHYAGASWMPWVLLAFEGLLRAPSIAGALGLGVAAGMQVLAGSGDLCLMTLVAGACLLPGVEPPPGHRLLSARALRHGALAILLAAGLAAVQWMPTKEMLASGVRPQQGEQGLYWSLHPASLPDLVALRVVSGLPLSPSARGALFEGRDPLLSSIYWGPVILMFVIVGAVLPGAGRWSLLLGLTFFLLAALGRHTPFYPLLLNLPLFPLLRYPTKYLWGASLFAALLAGQGVAAWTRPWGALERRRARVIGALIGISALAALSYAAILEFWPALLGTWLQGGTATGISGDSPAGQALVAALLLGIGIFAVFLRLAERAVPWSTVAVVLIGADLTRAGWDVNPVGPRALFQTRPALLDALTGAGAPRLYNSASRPGLPMEMPVRGPANWRMEWIRPLGALQRLIPPNPARWGIFGSFDGDLTGLAGRAHHELTALMHAARDRREGTVLLRLCGVDYVVTLDREILGGSLQEKARVDSVYASPVFLLSVPNPSPRIFVVSGVRPVAEADAVNALIGTAFDPAREVLVSGSAEALPTHEDFRGSARLLSRRADSLSIEADLDAPGMLVVLEAYHPGWRATVDGLVAPVLRTNALFRGVRLAAGRHRVEMVFRPPAALLGAIASLLSLLAALGIWIRQLPQFTLRKATAEITPSSARG